MSRSGYVDDLDDTTLNLYRGRVASAIRGKRGQKFLRELAAAMDAMPEKVLIADSLIEDGAVCAIGSALVARGMSEQELQAIDYEDPDSVAAAAGVASCMAAELEYLNDECGERYEPVHEAGRIVRHKRIDETPEERWKRMRDWVARNIHE